MARKLYDWSSGVHILDHSRRKHKILREYILDYLTVRCKLPQQERFRLAIVDGFAGGGRYEGGTAGSPLIIIEQLKRAIKAVNVLRVGRGIGAMEVECLLVFNDANQDAIKQLEEYATPLLSEISQTCPQLHIHTKYLNDRFESAYPKIERILKHRRYRSVLFNLDQCGDSHVDRHTIRRIMRSYPNAEIFYTFMISSLLAFLQKNEPQRLRKRLAHIGLTDLSIESLNNQVSRHSWLGTAERIVFDAFRSCAPFVSPFSINNPDGWRYWLIHFARSYRARQVYNSILHENASIQAHFGRSGLDMLHYDPKHHKGTLYLFDENGRVSGKNQLLRDIPQLVAKSCDAIPVLDFYNRIYNATPAHADDIHTAIIENPDLKVMTPAGGERRSANTIGVDDVITMRRQRSFFQMFMSGGTRWTE